MCFAQAAHETASFQHAQTTQNKTCKALAAAADNPHIWGLIALKE
jgi:hypothetical protein